MRAHLSGLRSQRRSGKLNAAAVLEHDCPGHCLLYGRSSDNSPVTRQECRSAGAKRCDEVIAPFRCIDLTAVAVDGDCHPKDDSEWRPRHKGIPGESNPSGAMRVVMEDASDIAAGAIDRSVGEPFPGRIDPLERLAVEVDRHNVPRLNPRERQWVVVQVAQDQDCISIRPRLAYAQMAERKREKSLGRKRP